MRTGRQGTLHIRGSAYWHSLVRWCCIRSYPDTAAAHGRTAVGAIRDALTRKPCLPPLPAAV